MCLKWKLDKDEQIASLMNYHVMKEAARSGGYIAMYKVIDARNTSPVFGCGSFHTGLNVAVEPRNYRPVLTTNASLSTQGIHDLVEYPYGFHCFFSAYDAQTYLDLMVDRAAPLWEKEENRERHSVIRVYVRLEWIHTIGVQDTQYGNEQLICGVADRCVIHHSELKLVYGSCPVKWDIVNWNRTLPATGIGNPPLWRSEKDRNWESHTYKHGAPSKWMSFGTL